MNARPIGIFDSGVGGTSVWKEIKNILPYEDTIYLADSKHAPYGEKPRAEILRLSIKNTELLLKKGCKLIVVACNTATTNAIADLRATYQVPFIGIEPAIKPAALLSKAKKVGILATKGTLSSSLFHSTSEIHTSGIQIIEQEGTGLVTLIEQGKIWCSETRKLLEQLLRPMLNEDIDYLVLGCTHYPYLIPVLRELLPEKVKIIDSGAAVARQAKAILEEHGLERGIKVKGEHIFFTNSDVCILNDFLKDEQASTQTELLEF